MRRDHKEPKEEKQRHRVEWGVMIHHHFHYDSESFGGGGDGDGDGSSLGYSPLLFPKPVKHFCHTPTLEKVLSI